MPNLEIPEPFEFLFEPKGTYRYRAAWGGRGSGKTHSFAAALVVLATTEKLRILCAREVQDSIKYSSKQVLEDRIAEWGLNDFYTITNTEILGKNGSRITFAGLRTNPHAIKSTAGIDIAWVDEASAISAKSLELLEPTVRDTNSELWFTWNPDHASDPVDDLFRGNSVESLKLKEKGTWEPPPRTMCVPVHWDGNPWFSDVLEELRRFHLRTDPDKYAHVWLGEYRRSSEARVFHNWRIGKEDEFDDTNVRRFYLGADWGWIDPTVLVRCYIDGRKLYVDHEAWQTKCPIDKVPELFDTVPGSRKWPITADSSNPQTIHHMHRLNYNITHSIKGPGSIEEGVDFLKGYDIIVHPRCKHVLDELASYSYDTDGHTGQVLPTLADKKNHTIDALRYALENLRRGSTAPVFSSY